MFIRLREHRTFVSNKSHALQALGQLKIIQEGFDSHSPRFASYSQLGCLSVQISFVGDFVRANIGEV